MKEGEPVVDIETEKITAEYDAPVIRHAAPAGRQARARRCQSAP